MPKRPLAVGLSFGIVSGVITTLGLIVGLDASTSSRLVVIGGVLTIAIADAFSDALGMHIGEESTNAFTPREVWAATFATFVAKFGFALTFLVPILLLDLRTAVITSVLWGIAVVAAVSAVIARREGESVLKVAGGHVALALLVVLVTNLVGALISRFFGGS